MIDNNVTLSRDQAAALEALYQICEIKVEEDSINITKHNYVHKLQEINSDFTEYSMCSQVGPSDFKEFSECFKEIVTGEGICYSANMLDYKDFYTSKIVRSLRYPKQGDRSNWTVAGYENNDPNSYPGRILGSGRKAGMSLRLTMQQKDVDYACKGAVNGFRLTLHTPDEVPRTASHFYRIPFGVETLIAVTPRGISTSENLRGYKPIKRQCFFPGEKRLKFFKSYTQANCKVECFAGEF